MATAFDTNMSTTVEARLLAKLDKCGPLPADCSLGRCWTWFGSKVPRGYGRLFIRKTAGVREFEYTHRLAWTIWRGPIAPGICVLHKCDNPPCCNPEHLFVGTLGDNNRDTVSKGRHAVQINPGLVCGDRNPNAKLSWDDVREMRALAGQGSGRLELANRFGVSSTMVRFIVTGKNWVEQ